MGEEALSAGITLYQKAFKVKVTFCLSKCEMKSKGLKLFTHNLAFMV